MLALESDFTTPHLNFYAKIDDHGVRRGDTGRLLAQWQHLVASMVAQVLPYWAMCSASYRLICVAIEMAREGGAFFLSSTFCHKKPYKRPCSGRLKRNLSYSIDATMY
jgi:hypothetical protein